MQGFPKHIATRQDIDNLIKLYPNETRAWLKNQWDNRFVLQINPAAQYAVKIAKSELSVPAGATLLARNQETGEYAYVVDCPYDRQHLIGAIDDGIVYGADVVESPTAPIFLLGFNTDILRAAPYKVRI